MILGACLALFFDMTAPFAPAPLVEVSFVPIALVIGAVLLASGMRAHVAAGSRWFEWAWDGKV